MKTIDVWGDNRFETYTKTRAGSRAVTVENGNILLSREENTDYWLLPGGGAEENETPEECCVREVWEETGCIVRPIRCFLILNEYYEEYRYISRYFVCEVTGWERQHLTEQEAARGLVPRWLPLTEALAIFSRHQDYAATNEEKRGAYLREYTALQAYMEEL